MHALHLASVPCSLALRFQADKLAYDNARHGHWKAVFWHSVARTSAHKASISPSFSLPPLSDDEDIRKRALRNHVEVNPLRLVRCRGLKILQIYLINSENVFSVTIDCQSSQTLLTSTTLLVANLNDETWNFAVMISSLHCCQRYVLSHTECTHAS